MCTAERFLKRTVAATEVELFHGTRSRKPEEVYRSEDEFDFRLSSLNALCTGTYFTASTKYSDNYSYQMPSNNEKQLLLAKVLVGESCMWPKRECSEDLHQSRTLKSEGCSSMNAMTVYMVTVEARISMSYTIMRKLTQRMLSLK